MKKAIVGLILPGAKVLSVMPYAWGALAGVVTYVCLRRYFHNKRCMNDIVIPKAKESGLLDKVLANKEV